MGSSGRGSTQNSRSSSTLVEADPGIPYNKIAFPLTAESIVHGHLVHPSRRQTHKEKEAERVQQGKPINPDPYQMLPKEMKMGARDPQIVGRIKDLKEEASLTTASARNVWRK